MMKSAGNGFAKGWSNVNIYACKYVQDTSSEELRVTKCKGRGVGVLSRSFCLRLNVLYDYVLQNVDRSHVNIINNVAGCWLHEG